MSYGDDVVWGTTGRILSELLAALFPETPAVRTSRQSDPLDRLQRSQRSRVTYQTLLVDAR